MRVALDTAYELKPPQYAQINRAHPLAQGLAGFWLVGAEGRFAVDVVSSLPLVSNNLGFSAASSPYGSSALGLGSNSCFYTNRLGPFRLQFPLTIFAIAMFNSLPASAGIGIVSSAGRVDAANTNNFAGIEIVYFNGLALQFGINGVFRNIASTFTPVVGNWYVLAGSARGSSDMSFYTNGVNTSGSYGGSGTTMDYANDTLGAGLGMIPGTLQHQTDVAILCGGIWNRSLSDAEHMQLAKQPFCMFNRRPIPVAA